MTIATLSEIETLRDIRQKTKQEIIALEKEVETLNKRILNLLKQEGKEEYTSDGLTVQIIQNTTTKYDWQSIKKTIGAVRWKSIVREVPDTDLLTAAIAEGKIKAKDISRHVSVEDKGDPYIKVARAKKEEVE